MPFKDIEAFEKYLEAIDEHYDEHSTIMQEVDIFIETDRKEVKRSDYAKGNNRNDEKVVRYQYRNCYIAGERLNRFF